MNQHASKSRLAFSVLLACALSGAGPALSQAVRFSADLRPIPKPGEAWRSADVAGAAAILSGTADRNALPLVEGIGTTVPLGMTELPENFNELRQSVTRLAGGGFAAVWNEGKAPALAVRLQMVRADGSVVFPHGGLTVASAALNHFTTILVAHPTSGVFVAFERWSPTSSSANQLIVQWVDASGKLRWPGEGVSAFGPLATNLYYYDPQLTAAGDGGVFVCATRSVFDGKDVTRCQRLAPGGGPLWGAVGRNAGGVPGWRVLPKTLADGSGGLLVFWCNKRLLAADPLQAQLIEGQRFAGDGRLLWGTKGKLIRTKEIAQVNYYIYSELAAVSDGQGGAIVAFNDWDGSLPATLDVLAQRVDRNGSLLWGTGVPVATGPVAQQLDSLTRVQSGAVITVNEFGAETSPMRIYRLSAAGLPLWGAAGRPFSDPAAVFALDYGAYGQWDGKVVRFASIHQRSAGTYDFDVYLSRYSLDGTALTPPGGVPLSTIPRAKFVRGFVYDRARRVGLAVFENYHPEPADNGHYDTMGVLYDEEP